MTLGTDLAGLTPKKSFFELMRRVDWLHAQRCSEGQGANRRRPAWLRMEQVAAMHFASAEVAEVNALPASFGGLHEGPGLRVVQRHFGLFAPYGPLPLHVTEHAMLEKRFERNAAFEQFLNLVSSDMAWLHYRAWAAMHPVLGYERARHAFVERLAGLSESDRKPGTAEDEGVRRHAMRCRRSWPGLYAGQQRPLPALQRMLRAYFRTPLSVVPRIGRWLSMSAAPVDRPRLGRWRLGSRAWDAQYTLDIEVGPVDADQFHVWHRRAAAVRALVAVVADYAEGAVQPAIHVRVRTRPEMAGRIGRMHLGVDAWALPGHGMRRITVHESFQDPV